MRLRPLRPEDTPDLLAYRGDAEVCRFLPFEPMDEAVLLELLESRLPILTIEEAVLQGGFGSAVLEFAHDRGYHQAVIERMGIPDRFIEHGSVSELLREIGLTAAHIVARIKTMAPRKQKRA